MSMGDNSVDSETLQSYVQRIENCMADKKAIQEDISELYKAAAQQGLDKKALRKLIAERAKPKDATLEETLEMYRAALGDLDGTPLGSAAVAARV